MLMRASGSFAPIPRRRPRDFFGRSGAISAEVLPGNPRTKLIPNRCCRLCRL